MNNQLRVPDATWEDGSESGNRSRLITTVDINGVPHHLEAYEVRTNEHDTQEGTTELNEEVLSEVYGALGGDDAWSTVEIEGRDYVLILTPYCT